MRFTILVCLLSLTACSYVVDADKKRLSQAEPNDMDPMTDAGPQPVCRQDNQCEDNTPCTLNTCNQATLTCESKKVDADGDGYVPRAVAGVACAGGTDCNDSGADQNGDQVPDGKAINPGAEELCDGIDNDCTGGVDKTCQGANCRISCLGDTCQRAFPLNVGTKKVTVEGGFNHFSNDYSDCEEGPGLGDGRDLPEVVYAVTNSASSTRKLCLSGNELFTNLGVTSNCNAGRDLRSSCGLSIKTRTYNIASNETVYLLIQPKTKADADDEYSINVRLIPTADDCDF